MNNSRYDASIKQYLKQGKDLFTVKYIDTIRDGGTRLISASNGDSYYVHMIDDTIHTAYPPKPDNQIKDKIFIDVLLNRIETYIETSEKRIETNIEMLNRIILK